MHGNGWSLSSIPDKPPDLVLRWGLVDRGNDPIAGLGFAAIFLNERGQRVRPMGPDFGRPSRNPFG